MVTVPTRAVAALLFALLVLPQLLLGRFLGLSPLWLVPSAAALAVLGIVFARGFTGTIPARTLAACLAVALLLCLLGGEGRVFYANPDWQVRDAVLRDLATYPWPFVYAGAERLLLRLPAAMYLLPALAGKAGGLGLAQAALLAQNAALLGSLLALGSALFERGRARAVALAVLVAFSGLDALGSLIVGKPVAGHLEWWTIQQYSSHLTQLFWVPQHAFAGWTGALLYLLWRRGRIGVGTALLPLPLLALWSPLGLAGLLPFAAHMLARRPRLAGLAPAGAAAIVALPSLAYLLAGSTAATQGSRGGMSLRLYLLFVAIEVLPYLAAIAITRRGARFSGATLALTAATLLLVPLLDIGGGGDVVMRTSIAALAILAVQVADLLTRAAPDREVRAWQRVARAALAIGAITPALEVARALTRPANPMAACSYLGVVPGGAPTYVAPLATLPSPIRPAHPAIATPHDPASCHERPLGPA